MKINIKLIGSLCKYFDGQKTGVLEFPQNSKAEEILKLLKIPSEYCSFMTVNGMKVPRDHILNDGDEVVVFPLVSGG